MRLVLKDFNSEFCSIVNKKANKNLFVSINWLIRLKIKSDIYYSKKKELKSLEAYNIDHELPHLLAVLDSSFLII